ncbi:helix-turn-helix transcriptional regulator [Gemmiger sp. An50]|uniref:helix-turn-helix domain-containing protein n=1 Tax=Gemmiger sp. An50 TaxID=1965639 RepID=UPI0013A64339|nr:helix-turn-helix transcriptional regulator [Gemmiger sp. An50]
MNILYERIESLCQERNITVGKLCGEIGIRRSLMSDLKMGRKQTLSTETLSKLSGYFGVSIDYLLGNVNDPYFHLDNQRIADEINSLDGYKKKPAAPQGSELSGVYLSFAKTAQDEGLDPADIEYALNLVRRIREQEKKRNRGE